MSRNIGFVSQFPLFSHPIPLISRTNSKPSRFGTRMAERTRMSVRTQPSLSSVAPISKNNHLYYYRFPIYSQEVLSIHQLLWNCAPSTECYTPLEFAECSMAQGKSR